MILITIAGFALLRPSLYEFLLFAASSALALQSVRNVALFVAATTPVLINTYGGWWRGVAAAREWKLQTPARPAFAAVTAFALVVITAATGFHVADDINADKQAPVDASTYPVEP